MAIDIPKTWYVSFELPKRVRKASARRCPRMSETFRTELDAQTFARQKFAEGYIVNAGTINPCRPRRVIPPALIQDWLTEILPQPLVELTCVKETRAADLR